MQTSSVDLEVYFAQDKLQQLYIKAKTILNNNDKQKIISSGGQAVEIRSFFGDDIKLCFADEQNNYNINLITADGSSVFGNACANNIELFKVSRIGTTISGISQKDKACIYNVLKCLAYEPNHNTFTTTDSTLTDSTLTDSNLSIAYEDNTLEPHGNDSIKSDIIPQEILPILQVEVKDNSTRAFNAVLPILQKISFMGYSHVSCGPRCIQIGDWDLRLLESNVIQEIYTKSTTCNIQQELNKEIIQDLITYANNNKQLLIDAADTLLNTIPAVNKLTANTTLDSIKDAVLPCGGSYYLIKLPDNKLYKVAYKKGVIINSHNDKSVPEKYTIDENNLKLGLKNYITRELGKLQNQILEIKDLGTFKLDKDNRMLTFRNHRINSDDQTLELIFKNSKVIIEALNQKKQDSKIPNLNNYTGKNTNNKATNKRINLCNLVTNFRKVNASNNTYQAKPEIPNIIKYCKTYDSSICCL